MASFNFLVFFIIYCKAIAAQKLIGYDCGSRNLNVTTLSLLYVGPCTVPDSQVEVKKRYIHLLQVNRYAEAKFIQCKVEIDRTAFECRWFSYLSLIHNGRRSYIDEVGPAACLEMHKDGVSSAFPGNVVRGLKVNSTITHSMTLGGSINSNNKCTAGAYADPYDS